MLLRYSLSILLIWSLLCHQLEGSVKKGFAMSFNKFLCDDFEAFGNMNWWYDWKYEPFYNEGTNCTGLDKHSSNHVPMVFGPGKLRNFKKHQLAFPDSAQAVLGFNEPNHFPQSNMTAKEAADLWPQVEEIADGFPLVSPAAAPCGNPDKCHGNTMDWFDDFFSNCSSCRVDYLATHYYGCNADNAMNYLKGLYDRYGLKIWLTEFACPKTDDVGRQLSYMEALLPKLEAADYIYRYSWFISRINNTKFVKTSANLLRVNSSTLTTLGAFYTSYVYNG